MYNKISPCDPFHRWDCMDAISSTVINNMRKQYQEILKSNSSEGAKHLFVIVKHVPTHVTYRVGKLILHHENRHFGIQYSTQDYYMFFQCVVINIKIQGKFIIHRMFLYCLLRKSSENLSGVLSIKLSKLHYYYHWVEGWHWVLASQDFWASFKTLLKG